MWRLPARVLLLSLACIASVAGSLLIRLWPMDAKPGIPTFLVGMGFGALSILLVEAAAACFPRPCADGSEPGSNHSAIRPLKIALFLRLAGAATIVSCVVGLLGGCLMVTEWYKDFEAVTLMIMMIAGIAVGVLTSRANRGAAVALAILSSIGIEDALLEANKFKWLPIRIFQIYIALRACWAAFHFHKSNLAESLPRRLLMKQTLTWSFAVLAVIAGVLGGTAFAFRRHYSAAAEQRLAELRQSNVPVTSAELGGWFIKNARVKEAPPELTRAVQELADLSRQQSGMNSWLRTPLPGPGERFPNDDRELLGLYLQLAREPLEIIRRELTGGPCRFVSDFTAGWSLKLPHLSGLATAGRLTTREALLAAEEGKTDEALRLIGACLDMEKAIDMEPLLVSQIVRFALQGIASKGLERVLGWARLNEEQAAMASPLFASADHDNVLRLVLTGERCLTVSLLAGTLDEQRSVMNTDSDGEDDKGLVTGLWLMRAMGIQARDLVNYLDVIREYEVACDLPSPERLAVAASVHQRVLAAKDLRDRWRLNIFSGLLLPVLHNLFDREAQARTAVLLARTALAVERFKLSRGRLPESLAELAPDFIPELPMDPFNGEPLRYERHEQGYRLRSVGPERRDGQGIPTQSDEDDDSSPRRAMTFEVP